ncbi:uncharacterized protein ACIBXB_003877 [Morphnus guianensis]
MGRAAFTTWTCCHSHPDISCYLTSALSSPFAASSRRRSSPFKNELCASAVPPPCSSCAAPGASPARLGPAPLSTDDGTPAKTSATPTESCSAALRVFDKLSLTLSVQSVSLSNTPSEAFAEQRGGTPRGPVPSSHSGRGLPVRILLLSKNPARSYQ